MSYTPVQLDRPLRVEQLYTVHYFEYTSSYSFAGESHDFWELLYVDKGSVCVTAGEERFDLGRGQMVFHPPGEFHALSANGVTAPKGISYIYGLGGRDVRVESIKHVFADLEQIARSGETGETYRYLDVRE